MRPPVPPRCWPAADDGVRTVLCGVRGDCAIASDCRIEAARRKGVVRELLPAAAGLATVGGSGLPQLAGQRLSRERARSLVADAAACCCCNAVRLADAVRARERATAFISSLRRAAATADEADGEAEMLPTQADDDDDGSINATRLRTSDDLR